MKLLKIIGALLFIVLSSSCSINKSLVNLQNNTLMNYQDTLKVTVSKIDSGIENKIPSCEIWNIDRNDFILMIKDYKDKNEIIRKKSHRAGNFFTIAGTTLGVGGGIYGLFSDSEPKGAAVTSLITGALTGLVGSLNLEKKAERANTCSDFLDGMMLDFAARWGAARCPRNEFEFKAYLSAKDAIIESLKSMRCYGLPASN
jgi:hypothetical protein